MHSANESDVKRQPLNAVLLCSAIGKLKKLPYERELSSVF